MISIALLQGAPGGVELVAPPAVRTLWWITLAVTVVAVVPLTIYLLHRLWQAARNIERYTAEALEAGGGIATNTASAAALENTAEAAGPLVERAVRVRDLTKQVADVLRHRAG